LNKQRISRRPNVFSQAVPKLMGVDLNLD